MKPRILLCVLALHPAAVAAEMDPVLAPILAHVAGQRDGAAAWSLDFSKVTGDRAALPIGVFDSGIGGLTVMEAILKLDAFHNDTLQPEADGIPDFAGERFLYFGDQANMPYGNYPARGREDLLRELIVKDAIFLLGSRWRPARSSAVRHDKPPVKALVIACNTATAYGIEDLRAVLRAWELKVPVIGVIEAGARAVSTALPDDQRAHGVGVLATVGTCSSGAYPKAIGRATGQAGKSAPVVVQQGSVGLAGAIEGNRAFVGADTLSSVAYQGPIPQPGLMAAYGFDPAGLRAAPSGPQLNSVPNYARYDVTTLLETHRQKGGPAIDTVVLGCTHFPLVQQELSDAFQTARRYTAADGSQPYAALVAAELRFIDPAQSTARELFRELALARLRVPDRGARQVAPPRCDFFFSVPNPESGARLTTDGSLENEYRLSRAIGNLSEEDTFAISLTPTTLPEASAALVRSLPAVWREMQGAR